MNTLFALLITIFVIVFFHELGHFLFAKLFGVKVEKFSIGFPPTLFKKTIGETEYSLGLIPLGGFVKMKGMLDESLDGATITGADDEFLSKKSWQKILILSGGVLFNLILAVIIFSSVTFFSGKTIIPGTTIGIVDSTSIGFKAGLRINDKIIDINDVKVHNWDDIQTTYLKNLNKDITIRVQRGGNILTLSINEEEFRQKNSEYFGIGPKILPVIGSVQPDTPADKAGLQSLDTILAFNGYVVDNWYQLTDSIRHNPEKEIRLSVKRGQDTLVLSAVPRAVLVEKKEGLPEEVGQLGISVKFDKETFSFISSIGEGFKEVENQFIMIFKGFYMLLTGVKSPQEMLGGPIVIAQMASTAASFGLGTLFQFIGSLSVILAIFNILPIPALDGGHILIIIIETVRRKPLELQTRIRIQQFGMIILLLLVVFTIFNDLSR
ncbi:MAG: RIP metalloprotease RseP [Calditrichia bacterium]